MSMPTGQTDGYQTVTLCFQLDLASVISEPVGDITNDLVTVKGYFASANSIGGCSVKNVSHD